MKYESNESLIDSGEDEILIDSGDDELLIDSCEDELLTDSNGDELLISLTRKDYYWIVLGLNLKL